MVKIILLIVFLLLLMLPVLSNGAQPVTLDFFWFAEDRTFSLGSVMLMFAGYGMVAMGIFGLLDRMELSLKNRKMKKQIATLEEELTGLRDIVTRDQEPS